MGRAYRELVDRYNLNYLLEGNDYSNNSKGSRGDDGDNNYNNNHNINNNLNNNYNNNGGNTNEQNNGSKENIRNIGNKTYNTITTNNEVETTKNGSGIKKFTAEDIQKAKKVEAIVNNCKGTA